MRAATTIVSGYMRSGTSMMVRVFEAGGLEVAFDPKRDRMNGKFGDEHYRPNPDGFYEIPLREYNQPGFPSAYAGKLIKIIVTGLPSICAGDYRLVLMRRDPEEIRQSLNAMTGQELKPSWCAGYERMMEHVAGVMRVRSDVELHCLDYRQVVENPRAAIASLGLSIDVDVAAAVIDPGKVRFKREELAVGI